MSRKRHAFKADKEREQRLKSRKTQNINQVEQQKKLVKGVKKQLNKVERMIYDLRLVVIETEA